MLKYLSATRNAILKYLSETRNAILKFLSARRNAMLKFLFARSKSMLKFLFINMLYLYWFLNNQYPDDKDVPLGIDFLLEICFDCLLLTVILFYYIVLLEYSICTHSEDNG